MGLNELAGSIKSHDQFLITSHVDPDGDSLGSQLALAGLLGHYGKQYFIINHNSVPDTYAFLPGAETIKMVVPGKKYEFNTALILDIGEWDRMGSVAALINPAEHTVINIDHHQSNNRFGNMAYVDTSACSTASLVYDLFIQMEAPLSAITATQLYTGILTDTGGFRFSNTTSRVLKTCAHLVDCGADPSAIMNKVYFEKSVLRVKVMESILSTLEFYHGNRIVSVVLDQSVMERLGRYAPADIIMNTEGIIDYIRSIQGVDIALFFKEDEQGVKVSFRSNRDGLDMNWLAGQYGGGGHMQAAGASINGTLKEVKPGLVEKTVSLIKKNEGT